MNPTERRITPLNVTAADAGGGGLLFQGDAFEAVLIDGGAPVVPESRPWSRPVHGWWGKRAFDVVLGLVLLLLVLPVMVIAALAVKLTSPGPVFYRQKRVGTGGSEFSVIKFRTMHVDAENRLLDDEELRLLYLSGSHKIPSRIDPRVTRVGRLFRSWSVDELPQLFNVLAGHMSLVGPRPIVPDELSCYGDLAHSYLDVRPGLTGLWQVSGRSHIQFPARAELDARYRSQCSSTVDLRILLRTPLAVLLRRGSD